jgi:hypothetical protein
MQAINHDNWQTEYYTQLNPEETFPSNPCLNEHGEPLG